MILTDKTKYSDTTNNKDIQEKRIVIYKKSKKHQISATPQSMSVRGNNFDRYTVRLHIFEDR